MRRESRGRGWGPWGPGARGRAAARRAERRAVWVAVRPWGRLGTGGPARRDACPTGVGACRRDWRGGGRFGDPEAKNSLRVESPRVVPSGAGFLLMGELRPSPRFRSLFLASLSSLLPRPPPFPHAASELTEPPPACTPPSEPASAHRRCGAAELFLPH